ncbi:MAG TPA: hypothetical protein PKD12_17865 [Nitrospira sp.]|nr:hypothetical protein [Nitrospira sp.]
MVVPQPRAFASCAVVLLIGMAISVPSIAIGEDDQIESEPRESYNEWKERQKKSFDKYFNAPRYTIALDASNISEYRITSENYVKCVLKSPQEGLKTMLWPSHTLSEAQDFIQLVKKGAVRSAIVQNGMILEILLKDTTTK